MMPIPAGGVLRAANVDIHGIGAADFTINHAMLWPLRAMVLPVPDPGETGMDLDELFDRMVTKDVDQSVVAATEQIDLETLTPDTTPFQEPGEANLGKIYDMGEFGVEVWREERLITFASKPNAYTPGTPDKYIPTFHTFASLSRPVRVDVPSWFVAAIASPTWDDVGTTVPTSFTEQQWGRYSAMDELIDFARLQYLGQTETGAETPFAELAQLIERLVEPTVLEETAGVFESAAVDVFAQAIFLVDVPTLAKKGTVRGD